MLRRKEKKVKMSLHLRRPIGFHCDRHWALGGLLGKARRLNLPLIADGTINDVLKT